MLKQITNLLIKNRHRPIYPHTQIDSEILRYTDRRTKPETHRQILATILNKNQQLQSHLNMKPGKKYLNSHEGLDGSYIPKLPLSFMAKVNSYRKTKILSKVKLPYPECNVVLYYEALVSFARTLSLHWTNPNVLDMYVCIMWPFI